MEFIWKTILLIFSGMILLRISGRKSISQMAIAQTVVMISIGSLIIQPIVERSIWRTIAAAAIFITFLILMEYLQLKFDFLEGLISGYSKVVIENGEINETNLRKLRFTVDKLEMRLRQQGISKISDVKTATLEPNGQLGYELKRQAQPLTIGEFEKMMGFLIKQNQPLQQEFNIYDEVKENGHDKSIPNKLQ